MNNKIQIAESNLPMSTTPQTLFTNSGDNGLQIANSGQVIANTNIFLLNGGSNSCVGQDEVLVQLQSYLGSRSNEYYNLFVIGGESFDNGRFFVPPNRALTESIEKDIKTNLAELSDSAITQIKRFPSLFMSETDNKNAEQTAYYGFLTDIKIQENGIRISFYRLNPLPQQKLREIYRELALQGNPNYNELNRTHWTIKRINLLEELRIAGLNVF